VLRVRSSAEEDEKGIAGDKKAKGVDGREGVFYLLKGGRFD